MKGEIKIIFILVIGAFLLLELSRPLKELLIAVDFDKTAVRYLPGILVRLTLSGILLYIIIKLQLARFAGLKPITKAKNLQAVIIVFLIILLVVGDKYDYYRTLTTKTLVLSGIFYLFVGIFEELLFRGAIFPLFIKNYSKHKNVLIISAFLSSALFGLVHYINLIYQPDNIGGITSQVIFAFAFGIFLCGLLLRTETIIIPAIIHGLINFSFGGILRDEETTTLIQQAENLPIDWVSMFSNVGVFLLIIIGGLYMIRKTNKEAVLNKLGINYDNQ